MVKLTEAGRFAWRILRHYLDFSGRSLDGLLALDVD
jgi:hypothetical protein